MDAPYLRIVDEIRGRIASGVWPGDRVPSARQITQEWAWRSRPPRRRSPRSRPKGWSAVVGSAQS